MAKREGGISLADLDKMLQKMHDMFWLTEKEAKMTEFEREVHRLEREHPGYPVLTTEEIPADQVDSYIDQLCKGVAFDIVVSPESERILEKNLRLYQEPHWEPETRKGATLQTPRWLPLDDSLPHRDLTVELQVLVSSDLHRDLLPPMYPGQEGHAAHRLRRSRAQRNQQDGR